MNDNDNKQKEQIEALASIADFVTQKEILKKEDIRYINSRLDNILATFENNNTKFFKRLL